MGVALKRCPFCGGEAEIERPGTARQSMIVTCTDCGAQMESGNVAGLTEPSGYAWNRRAPSPAIEKAREAIETLLFWAGRREDSHTRDELENAIQEGRDALALLEVE
jgi:Lar family restriction alleviation protein